MRIIFLCTSQMKSQAECCKPRENGTPGIRTVCEIFFTIIIISFAVYTRQLRYSFKEYLRSRKKKKKMFCRPSRVFFFFFLESVVKHRYKCIIKRVCGTHIRQILSD